ncbi:MAG: HlyD family efflux transporter periplasmic adaptor subunit [Bacteroidetes bacterium]|nr:HlyD family efflux transporter periplasmic adaptor subunit [Bacteroidota bacterium]
MKRISIQILTALGLIWAGTSCKSGNNDFDASGVFEATETVISAESQGKIIAFDLQEGQELKSGQKIGEIDCQNLNLQKSQLEATIEALKLKQNDAAPQVEILKQQLSTQAAQINTQREQLRVLDKEKSRLQNLVAAEAIPSKQLDDVSGQVDILKKQISTSESQLGVLKQQIRSAEQQVGIQNRGILSEKKPLEARVAQMNDLIGHCQIINPLEGTVLVKYAETNEVTAPGKPLYKIAALQDMTLRAYITGDQLSKIKVGSKVKVFVDKDKEAYKELPGEIEWISSKAEFTPKTIQTKDERGNLVYAIKVKVKNDGYLKIGMYGELKL